MAWNDLASGGLGVSASPWSSDPLPASPWNTTGSSGGIDAATIAKALGELHSDLPQQPAVSNLTPGANAATGQAASGAYSGNPAGMHGLVQMLMERVAALRAASNPANARPVNLQGGSRPSGLLGL